VSAGGHFRDGVPYVLAPVAGAATGWSGGRGAFSRGGLRLGKRRFFRHRGVTALPQEEAVVMIEKEPAECYRVRADVEV